MRTAIAVLSAAFLAALPSAAPASASTVVNVRIEGRSETLFEGPVLAEPHGVRASSDPIAPKLRRCDGTEPGNPARSGPPAPTPTAVGADAMTLAGQGFDGRWYEGLGDYLVTRWGPDAEDASAGRHWGLVVNDTFTAVGGCQYRLGEGDALLWAYDAFRPGLKALALLPASPHYESGPRPLIAEAESDGSLEVEVVSYPARTGTPPAVPGREGSDPYTGATIAPVAASGGGGDEGAGTSDHDGLATIEFERPGWHRIKATVGSPGAESVIRSNRLDVCVADGVGEPLALEGATDCGDLPAADKPRSAPPTVGEIEERQRGGGGDEGSGTGGAAAASGGAGKESGGGREPAGQLRLSRPRLGRGAIRRGRLRVSWRLLSPGPGLRGWAIAARHLGRRGGGFVVRARGGQQRRWALVRLSPGRSYRLRMTVVDALGRSSSLGLGKVTVPAAAPRARHARARRPRPG